MSDEAKDKAKDYAITSWEAIKLSFSAGVGIVKKGWTIIVLAGALAGAAGYIFYLNNKQEKTAEQLAKIEEHASKLEEQSRELIKLNQENQAVYQQLTEDRAQVTALIMGFNTQMQASAKALSKIGTSISTLKDGEVAPVLKETVRQLQALRLEEVAKYEASNPGK